mmetsp:Transcript_115797/g.327552  ORF Transcript_115797/g.327552 Transcript_115797/m.327552 type:complete len:251 (-) Transcript_115797:208-960(-)
MFYSAIALITLLGTVSAFVAPANNRLATRTMKMAREGYSEALPFEPAPSALENVDYAGNAGFDFAGFANKPLIVIDDSEPLKWYREAEIVHGRVAQLAVLGFLVPQLYHWGGYPEWGIPDDAFAEMNPYKAIFSVPRESIGQIILGIFAVECFRIQRVIFEGKPAGDLGLGQGGWNPFGFDYTEEEYAEKQLQEIKHGRLAMFGALGMLLQLRNSGMGVGQQLAEAFSVPSDRAFLEGSGTLHDFFPAGL